MKTFYMGGPLKMRELIVPLAAAGLFLFGCAIGMSRAHAGTITVTIVTAGAPCNAGACTKTYTDSDANLAKIVVAYGPFCQASNLVGNPPVPTACSSLQTLAFWFDSLIQGTKGNVTSYYTQDAISKLAPVVPIDPK